MNNTHITGVEELIRRFPTKKNAKVLKWQSKKKY